MRWVMMVAATGCGSYPATDEAIDALRSDEWVFVDRSGDFTAFLPRYPVTDRAVAFYPGAKVEPEAYAPMLNILAQEGVPSVLVGMPGDLAVLAPKKGDKAIEEFASLGPWFAAGHSLGGAMAATWFSKRLDALAGLALIAAYPASGVDLSQVDHPVVSITATEDRVLDRTKWRERRSNLPARTTYVEIEGGNHAGFGAYGVQDGDGQATLCPEEQWEITAEALMDLVVR